jgi:hypothetical protein
MLRRLPVFALALGLLAFVATPATAGDADDERIAKQGLIKASDLPEGWVSEPSPEGDSSGLPECEAIDRADERADRGPSARSRAFGDPDAPEGISSVENSVWVFPTVKAAKQFFAVFTSDAAVECLQASGDEAAEATGLGGATVEEINLPRVGDARIGYAVLVGDGDPLNTIYAEQVLVRVGRAATGFTAENLGSSLPQGPDLLDAVVGRLERAL